TGEVDPKHTIRPNLRYCGADLSRVYFPERPVSGGRRRFQLPRHAGELTKACQDCGAGLLILDPITSHIEDGYLPDSGQAARAVMECLGRIGEDASLAPLAIKHPRKGTFGPLIQRVSGSIEWTQTPRAVLYLVCPD